MNKKQIIIGLVVLAVVGVIAGVGWAGIAKKKIKKHQIQKEFKTEIITPKQPEEPIVQPKNHEFSKEEFFEKFKQGQISPQELERLASERKMYRDEKYGFEFQYPAIYDSFERSKLKKLEEGNVITLGDRIWIGIKDSKGQTLSEIKKNIELQKKEILQTPSKLDEEDRFDYEEISINGNPAIIVRDRTLGMGRYGETVYLEKRGRIYSLSFFAGGSFIDMYTMYTQQKKLPEYLNEFNVFKTIVIPSFKFIEK